MLHCKANTLAYYRDENKSEKTHEIFMQGVAPVMSSSMEDSCCNAIVLLSTRMTESTDTFFFLGERVIDFKYIAHFAMHH